MTSPTESDETILDCAIATIRYDYECEAVRDDADAGRLNALRDLAGYLRGASDKNFAEDGVPHIVRAYPSRTPKVVDEANDIRTVQVITG